MFSKDIEKLEVGSLSQGTSLVHQFDIVVQFVFYSENNHKFIFTF